MPDELERVGGRGGFCVVTDLWFGWRHSLVLEQIFAFDCERKKFNIHTMMDGIEHAFIISNGLRAHAL